MTKFNTAAVATAVAVEAGLTQFDSESKGYAYQQPVSVKADDGSFKVIGYYTCYLPALADFGITPSAVTATDDEGLPVFASDSDNWLFKAIITEVKAQARNRLKPRSLDTRDGRPLFATFADCVKVLEAANGKQTLAERNALISQFKEFLAGAVKSDSYAKLFADLFTKPSMISLQAQKVRDVMIKLVETFGASLLDSEADLTTYQEGMLSAVLEACEEQPEEDEFNLDDLL